MNDHAVLEALEKVVARLDDLADGTRHIHPLFATEVESIAGDVDRVMDLAASPPVTVEGFDMPGLFDDDTFAASHDAVATERIIDRDADL